MSDLSEVSTLIADSLDHNTNNYVGAAKEYFQKMIFKVIKNDDAY